MSVRLFAIVVTYDPDPAALGALCSLLRQSAEVIVVDNSSAENAPVPVAGIDWYSMGSNAGIAAAQNVGIRAALSKGADVLAFFDQDSTPDERLIHSLVAALGCPPDGIAAPICVDMRTGAEYPPFRFDRWGCAHPVPASMQKKPISADLIISSGSVAAAEVFGKVGLMDESLFIDYVDLEWCIRCRRAGVSIQVIPAVTMPHSIGNKVIKHGALTTFVHSPYRAYYRLRNAFLLLRMTHVPRLYAIHEIFAALLHHLLQWRHSTDRGQHLRLGWRGLLDGIQGVGGKLELR